MIDFTCDHCGKAYSLKDRAAGRKAKCAGCGVVLVVPDAPSGDAEPDGEGLFMSLESLESLGTVEKTSPAASPVVVPQVKKALLTESQRRMILVGGLGVVVVAIVIACIVVGLDAFSGGKTDDSTGLVIAPPERDIPRGGANKPKPPKPKPPNPDKPKPATRPTTTTPAPDKPKPPVPDKPKPTIPIATRLPLPAAPHPGPGGMYDYETVKLVPLADTKFAFPIEGKFLGVSDEGKTVACQTFVRGAGLTVTLANETGTVTHEWPKWFKASDIVFCPGSLRAAYLISRLDPRKKGGEVFASVVDGKIVQEDIPRGTHAVFSADGKRAAWSVRTAGGRYKMIVDGEESDAHRSVGMYRFSPDGSQFAYVAGIDSRTSAVVLNGEISRPYARIGLPTADKTRQGQARAPGLYFSPDSRHLAYFAMRLAAAGSDSPSEMVLRKDTSESAPYAELIGHPVWSPNSSDVACIARGDKPGLFVVTGAGKGKAYADIVPESLRFSPDSRRVVYVTRASRTGSLRFDPKGKVTWRLVDGVAEGSQYVYIDVGGMGFNERNEVVYLGSHECRIIDDDPVHAFAQIVGSAEARQLTDEGVYPEPPRRPYTVAEPGGGQSVTIDGRLGTLYKAVADVQVSADGRHVAYRATAYVKNLPRDFVVIDDAEVVLSPGEKISALTFVAPRLLGGVIYKDGKFTHLSMAIASAEKSSPR